MDLFSLCCGADANRTIIVSIAHAARLRLSTHTAPIPRCPLCDGDCGPRLASITCWTLFCGSEVLTYQDTGDGGEWATAIWQT